MSANTLANRMGVFVELSEATKGNLGRTTLMKLCYFLQALRDVPLGYKFTLYSYGPFDSDVLADLQTAETMGVLSANVEYYPGGYRYDIQPDENGKKAKQLAKAFLADYRSDIEWVTKKFGNRSAIDLELLSTIVYINSEQRISQRNLLAARVKLVKPHFSQAQIERQIEWLDSNDLLLAA
jgi:uncharacterized protein YwgA